MTKETDELWAQIRTLKETLNVSHAAKVGILRELREAKTRVEKAEAAIATAPKDPIAEGWSQAASDVLAERQRQISAKGWTPDHDDEHRSGELAGAAACYAAHTCEIEDTLVRSARKTFIEAAWPWAFHWWKPKDRRRDLIKAAALILAEIERLDRLPAPPTTGEQK